MDLVITVATDEERTVVHLRGDIDIFSGPQLHRALVELVDTGHLDMVVDLEEVEFIDSTGLNVLVGALKRVRAQNGTLRLVCSHERILRLFRITMPPKVFPIHDTLSQAMSAVT